MEVWFMARRWVVVLLAGPLLFAILPLAAVLLFQPAGASGDDTGAVRIVVPNLSAQQAAEEPVTLGQHLGCDEGLGVAQAAVQS
jgi:hypothetical protein